MTISENRASIAAWFVRLMTGCVFLSEGIQKLLFADTLGSGRFARIGIPAPDFFGPFVGTVEILGGILILVGLWTRYAAIPLTVVMIVAIVTTKIPMLTEKGFWIMAHESRTDWAMLIGLVVIQILGSGRWSLDGRSHSKTPSS